MRKDCQIGVCCQGNSKASPYGLAFEFIFSLLITNYVLIFQDDERGSPHPFILFK